MAVNQKRRAEKLLKARAKAKERKKQRDQWQSQWAPEYADFEEVQAARYDLLDTSMFPDPAKHFGMQKSSEVLLELIEPLNLPNITSGKLLSLAQLGVTAWNLALMPEDKRLGLFNEAVKRMPIEMKAIVFGFIERKLALFPDDDRFILDVTIREEENGEPTLLVMSAIIPPENRR